ncbi:hypothetical protein B0A52_01163 [Exophiala mesophila]|uniref:N-acetyltransferase domain-containing protein n=1 Tax=Exophiala mesophila TaxID=212818 RepID=A0A438NGQ5_EXOME|nr:hypothetical protein B0A52_01163 [Exophiala mesophila]
MATTARTATRTGTTGTTPATKLDSIESTSSPTLQSKPRPYTLRRAQLSDLSPAARTVSLGFWDDVLFGRLIHPFRNSYPSHVDKYWYRKFIVDYWDWSHVMLVTTEPAEGDTLTGGKPEIVTGFAHWSRIAPTRQVNYKASWGLPWWDPRRMLKPVFALFSRLLGVISPNRAVSKTHETILEQSYHFLDHIWTGPRSESWYLECIAVHPDYQGRGQGRALVQWGLQKARDEGIACSVISAEGKETFYERCGFDSGPVARSGEGGLENPLREVEGGICFFKDKEGVVVKDRVLGDWTYGPGDYDWAAWTQKVEKKLGEDQSEGDEAPVVWKTEAGSPWRWREV